MTRGSMTPSEGGMLATVARQRPLEAEESLMLAVLEQAVSDLSDSSAEVRADADQYIYKSGDEGMFSFHSVCAYFKLSPTAVRQALRVRRREKPRDSMLRNAA